MSSRKYKLLDTEDNPPYNEGMNKIKINLEQIRLEYQAKVGRQISKTELADTLKTSRSTLDNWLSGDVGRRFDLDLAIRICDYFQVPLSELVEYTPKSKEEA